MGFERPIELLSKPVSWEGGDWLWSCSAPPENDYASFSASFHLEGEAEEAWLAFACDTSARVYINDQLRHVGPPREVPPFFYYDVLDLRSALRTGENEIELLVHHCGVPHQSHDSVPAGIMLQGEIRSSSGLQPISRMDWRVGEAPQYRRDVHRLGPCLGFAEHLDLTAQPCARRPPVIARRFGEGPLLKPLARDLPRFEVETFSHVRIEAGGEGCLIDMGREVFGFVALELELPVAATLRIGYAEALTDGRVIWTKGGMQYFDRLTAAAGNSAFQTYEKRAFRYIRVDDPRVSVIGARVFEYRYPHPPARGVPRSSRESRLFRLAERTMRINSEDLLIDCPWRERAQYSDPFICFGAMKRIFGSADVARRYLRQMFRGLREREGPSMCYPSPPQTLVIPDFALLLADQILAVCRLTGDRDLLEEGFPLAEKAHLAVASGEGADGLLRNLPGWNFLDNNLHFPRKPASAGMNAIYAGSCLALSEMARLLGLSEQAAGYAAKAQELRLTWRRTFLQPDRILDADSSPDLERLRCYNYLHPRPASAFSITACLEFAETGEHEVKVGAWSPVKIAIDGVPQAAAETMGTWLDPALTVPLSLRVGGRRVDIAIDVAASSLDQEVYLASNDAFGIRGTRVDGKPAEWRPWIQPFKTQVSTGFASCFGLIEGEEARRYVKSVLRPHYYTNYDRKTTPLFVEVTADEDKLRDAVTPCNTPWSLYYFCRGLRRAGMHSEARQFIHTCYAPMLQKDCSSLWEEWKEGSSLCHLWGTAPLEFLFDAEE